jgi:hypothetical protein
VPVRTFYRHFFIFCSGTYAPVQENYLMISVT